MTDTAHDKESKLADPVGAGETTNHDEPLDVDNEEKDYIEVSADGDPSSHGGSEKDYDEKGLRPDVHRTKSYATTTSAVTRTESNASAPPQKKAWYRQINPVRWGGVPPVPEVRGASREYTASFFSLVYFQWMAPIMSVRYSHIDLWSIS